MSNTSLQLFCNRIVEAGVLTRADVQHLSDELLRDGILDRDEADLLLALDRSVESDASFAAFLVAAIVDFAVWGERPTGTIDRETAAWLSASIAGRSGPTPTGSRIAVEIVREADVSDEAMIAFALQANRWTRLPADVERPRFALAA